MRGAARPLRCQNDERRRTLGAFRVFSDGFWPLGQDWALAAESSVFG